jgi:hypothetical protein
LVEVERWRKSFQKMRSSQLNFREVVPDDHSAGEITRTLLSEHMQPCGRLCAVGDALNQCPGVGASRDCSPAAGIEY